MGDPAAPTPPWEWGTATIRALMKVRGDSAHTLAKDLYVVTRAVEGWLYDGRSPNPGSAKQLYRLWAQLDGWQREVFDSLRANPPATTATQSPSAERPRQAAAVPTLDPPARTPGNGGSTDRGQFCKALGVTLAATPPAALERIAADMGSGGRVDASLVASHEVVAEALAGQFHGAHREAHLARVDWHASALLALLDRPMGNDERRRLDMLATAAHAHAAVVALQTQRRADVRRCLGTARNIADDSGSPALQAQALALSVLPAMPWMSTSELAIQPSRADRILSGALGQARGSCGRAEAWLHRWMAIALAVKGDERGFRSHAEQADLALSRPSSARPRGFLDRYAGDEGRETGATEGMALRLLGRADHAEPALARALEAAGTTSTSWRAMLLVDLAAVRVLQNDPEDACQSLTAALDLAKEAGYSVATGRVLGVRARFPEPWDDLACVRELDRRLRAITV